ncbi:hypothetical protein BLOT_009772 [Blomia tropicalis]|nr:hypothetical protein BLOT_011341 [Blomia tropicalis]KAI2801951.1 hypothetical protein BLOT_009772 [Blomia tropicalis]
MQRWKLNRCAWLMSPIQYSVHFSVRSIRFYTYILLIRKTEPKYIRSIAGPLSWLKHSVGVI